MSETIDITKMPYPTRNMFEVKESSYPGLMTQKYQSPFYNQQTYCQRNAVKPFQRDQYDTDRTNLYDYRPTTEDDIQQDLETRDKAGGPQVIEPYRSRFLRNQGHEKYETPRSNNSLNPDLVRQNFTKLNENGSKQGFTQRTKSTFREHYPTYGFSDQPDIYSSSGYINNDLNEELKEPFKLFNKDYNIIDIGEFIVFIILCILLFILLHDYVYCKTIGCEDCCWIPKMLGCN